MMGVLSICRKHIELEKSVHHVSNIDEEKPDMIHTESHRVDGGGVIRLEG